MTIWPKIALCGLSLIAISSFADCPRPADLTTSCALERDPRNCAWVVKHGPGWEGYVVGVDHGDTSAVSFIQAGWWNYERGTEGEDGTVFCWYVGDKGSTIRMSQGNYGGVPMPKNFDLWHPGFGDGRPMLICNDGVTACQFKYTGR